MSMSEDPSHKGSLSLCLWYFVKFISLWQWINVIWIK